MWSVRMRASKIEEDREIHISGAEGIFEFNQIEKAMRKFLKRAFEHSKGRPEKIILTIEEIRENLVEIKSLPIETIFCKSPDEAFEFMAEKLSTLGISPKAFSSAREILNIPMRGAALIDYKSGERIERDRERGIRVSRIQISQKRKINILRKIKNISNDPQRVIEAITIASKVAACKDIVAELCISDNPDYTTGYIASREFGYLRITNIKKIGDSMGGRVFFTKTPLDIDNIYKFLEKTPVIVI